MSAQPQLSVVIPIYNEESLLFETAESLAEHLDRLVGPGEWEYVLVDNGSRDATPAIVRKIAATWPGTAIELPAPNFGAALRAGLNAASGRWAHVINTDFWDYPFLAWAWLHRDDYELMIGSKRGDPTLNSQTRYRRTLSWGLNAILSLLFGFPGTDTHGLKLLDMRAMRPVLDQCVMDRGQFDTEFTLRAMRRGVRLAEVPVPFADRRRARNWMISKVAWNLMDIFRLRRLIHAIPWSGPLRFHRWSREDVESAVEQLAARRAPEALSNP